MPDEPILIKSTWTAADLDGKTVEFRIREKGKNGQSIPIQGNGVFRAIDCPDGLIRIEVIVRKETPYKGEITTFFCPQESENSIVKQTTGSRFDFSLSEF